MWARFEINELYMRFASSSSLIRLSGSVAKKLSSIVFLKRDSLFLKAIQFFKAEEANGVGM